MLVDWDHSSWNHAFVILFEKNELMTNRVTIIPTLDASFSFNDQFQTRERVSPNGVSCYESKTHRKTNWDSILTIWHTWEWKIGSKGREHLKETWVHFCLLWGTPLANLPAQSMNLSALWLHLWALWLNLILTHCWREKERWSKRIHGNTKWPATENLTQKLMWPWMCVDWNEQSLPWIDRHTPKR